MEHPYDPRWSAATPPPYAPGVPPAARPVPVIPLGGYPDGLPVAPPAPVLVSRPPRRRLGAILAVVGAAVLAFGTFVPWATADRIGSGITRGNGWHHVLGGTPWGPVMLMIALAVAIAVGPTLAGAPTATVARLGVGASLAGIVAVGLLFAELLRSRPGVELHLEVGPFVMLSAAFLALLGTALAARPTGPAIVTAPRAVGAVG